MINRYNEPNNPRDKKGKWKIKFNPLAFEPVPSSGYQYTDLSKPIGSVELSIPGVNNYNTQEKLETNKVGNDIGDQKSGWGKTKHSDAWDQTYPKIFRWYHGFVKSKINTGEY
ncbi:hypothetical protein MNBD_BACTEROID05-952 [hydrothermal vent metagenome]|uniref:Uncharacterized protein n=1 Tax=hydrothermal vent metagenome TaxID=652676 RepID=A0A3B0UDD5_9ZZZZ